jgi:hypothetical protein
MNRAKQMNQQQTQSRMNQPQTGQNGQSLASYAPAAAEQTLTTEQATLLSERKGLLDLDAVTTLTDESAAALSRHRGRLTLRNLSTLSPAAAQSLAQHRGPLALDGLVETTEEVALLLATHKAPLSLNALAALSDSVAIALAQHRGDLSLNGLRTLSEKAAAALAMHRGALSLNGLTDLSPQAAVELAQHHGELFLDGAAELNDVVLQRLSRRNGHLSLSGIEALSDAGAVALGRHNGPLILDGLKTLKPHQEAALLEHRGQVSLAALPELSRRHFEILHRQVRNPTNAQVSVTAAGARPAATPGVPQVPAGVRPPLNPTPARTAGPRTERESIWEYIRRGCQEMATAFYAKRIPPDVESKARSSLGIPAEVNVWCVMPYAAGGPSKHCCVIADSGLYERHSLAAPWHLPWHEMARCTELADSTAGVINNFLCLRHPTGDRLVMKHPEHAAEHHRILYFLFAALRSCDLKAEPAPPVLTQLTEARGDSGGEIRGKLWEAAKVAGGLTLAVASVAIEIANSSSSQTGSSTKTCSGCGMSIPRVALACPYCGRNKTTFGRSWDKVDPTT